MTARAPFGSAFERHPSDPARRRRRLERRDWLAIALALVAGVVFGLALHFTDSLAPDLAFIGVAGKAVFGIAMLFATFASLMAYAGGERRNLLMCLAIIGGTLLGYPLGPGITPGIVVPGMFSVSYELPAGEPPVSGTLQCDWAPGRARVARLTSGVIRFAGRDLTLRIDFYGSRVSLDDPERTAYVRFGADALQPGGAGAPPRTADDRTGSIHLDLLPNIAVDPTGPEQVVGTLTWECQAPPLPA